MKPFSEGGFVATTDAALERSSVLGSGIQRGNKATTPRTRDCLHKSSSHLHQLHQIVPPSFPERQTTTTQLNPPCQPQLQELLPRSERPRERLPKAMSCRKERRETPSYTYAAVLSSKVWWTDNSAGSPRRHVWSFWTGGILFR